LPNQQTVDYPSFKLVIVGDGGTGMCKYFYYRGSVGLNPCCFFGFVLIFSVFFGIWSFDPI